MSEQIAETFVDVGLPGFKKGRELLAAIFGNNDAAFQKALEEEYRDLTLELNHRIDLLEQELKDLDMKFDEFKASQEASIFKMFRENYTSATNNEKREALINAYVRFRDPRTGNQATRDYWWEIISAFSGMEIEVITALAKGVVVSHAEGIDIIVNPTFQVNPEMVVGGEYIEYRDGIEGTTFSYAIGPMWRQGRWARAIYLGPVLSKRKTDGFVLTKAGENLWKMMEPISSSETIPNSPFSSFKFT
jgi:hypothetical protein